MTTALSHLLQAIELGNHPTFPKFRTWLGPLTGSGSPVVEIVSKIGLHAEGREADFTPVAAEDAPIWFVHYATSSLMHGASPIPPAYLEQVQLALAQFGADATFLSKGQWTYTRRHHILFQSGGGPLEPAILMEDGGIVGYTADTGFVLWVIEED